MFEHPITVMNFLFRPPMRSGHSATVPTLSSAAVTLLGLRVTRHQILRVSALLTLRTLFTLVDLPLHDSVTTYLWTFLFSSAQAGVAVAAVGSMFNTGGLAGRLAGRLFSPSDGPFVRLYARIVLIVGPMVTLLETAVIVYEVMRMARLAEERMFELERSHGATWPRRALLGLAATLLAGIVGVTTILHQMYEPTVAFVGAVATTAALGVGLLTDDGNIVEATAIGLYVTTIWVIGIIEEDAMPTPFLQSWWIQSRKQNAEQVIGVALQGDETRAGVLVISLLTLLFTVARAPAFVRVLALGKEGVEQEAGMVTTTMHSRETENILSAEGDNRGDDVNGIERQRRDGISNDGSGGYDGAKMNAGKTGLSAVTLLAATFRVLIWAGQLRPGEYLAGPCRLCQIFASVVMYLMFATM